MRRLETLILLLSTIVAGQVATGHLPCLSGRNATPAANRSVVGAWLITLSSTNQGVGAPLSARQTSLITFHDDGTMLVANAGQLPLLPPGSGLFFTAGHGEWVASGPDTVTATFIMLVLNQTGSVSSTNTGTMQVTLGPDGNSYTGSLTINAVSSSGNPSGTQESSLQGTRIQAQPARTPAA